MSTENEIREIVSRYTRAAGQRDGAAMAQPIMNSDTLVKVILRPNRSPNMPIRTVMIVSASRYAVITQDRWVPPPRSLTMVGRAVETMV